MVAKRSAPVTSGVIPPVVVELISICSASARVRSGEMGTKSSPILVDFSTRFAPAYTTSGLLGESRYGVFQLKRSCRLAESAVARACSSAMRWACSLGIGCMLSGHTIAIESCRMRYESRQFGRPSDCRSPVARFERPMLPPCDSV